MIKKFFEWVMSPMGRVAAIIGALALFSLAAYGISESQKTPDQPIQFPHVRHVAAGVPCLYCHPGALRGPSPGLPTINKCWGCHQQLDITKTSPLLAPMRARIDYSVGPSGQPKEGFVWIPVAQVPDFVHFTHRPHIAAGLNCENCHGDVSKMTIYQNPQVMNMGWCLACHRARTEDNAQNNPNNDPAVSALLQQKRTKLTDCGTCHY
jgi:Cytochrome c7 and related cytochrome c